MIKEVVKVKCNMCEAVFEEDEIDYDGDQEFCPECSRSGFLMDLYEENIKNK